MAPNISWGGTVQIKTSVVNLINDFRVLLT